MATKEKITHCPLCAKLLIHFGGKYWDCPTSMETDKGKVRFHYYTDHYEETVITHDGFIVLNNNNFLRILRHSNNENFNLEEVFSGKVNFKIDKDISNNIQNYLLL